MKTMKNALELFKLTVVLVAMAYLTIVLMVAMVDPACGADGYSQTACLAEINDDLLNLVLKAVR